MKKLNLLFATLLFISCDNRTNEQKCADAKNRVQLMQHRLSRIALPKGDDVLPLEWAEQEVVEYCK